MLLLANGEATLGILELWLVCASYFSVAMMKHCNPEESLFDLRFLEGELTLVGKHVSKGGIAIGTGNSEHVHFTVNKKQRE